MIDGNDDGEDPVKTKKKKEDPVAKAERLAKEALQLQEALKLGDVSVLKNRVAGILNLYPHTRNSDISLALKYWETYHRDFYSPLSIKPADMFRLERITHITRVRAKIQNEYRLFLAEDNVRRRRRGLESNIKEAIVEDGPSRRIINVFADETGKNGRFVIVAAVWVLRGQNLYSISNAIAAWQQQVGWGHKEVHFKDFKQKDVALIPAYLDVIKRNRDFLSFKLTAVDQTRSNRRVTETVRRLHEKMLIQGAHHEIQSNRVDLPFEINLVMDKDDSLDEIAISDIRSRVADSYRSAYNGQLELIELSTMDSKSSPLLQLADLIAGAANRRRNHEGERGHKDDIADLIIDTLDLVIEQDDDIDSDASAYLKV